MASEFFSQRKRTWMSWLPETWSKRKRRVRSDSSWVSSTMRLVKFLGLVSACPRPYFSLSTHLFTNSPFQPVTGLVRTTGWTETRSWPMFSGAPRGSRTGSLAMAARRSCRWREPWLACFLWSRWTAFTHEALASVAGSEPLKEALVGGAQAVERLVRGCPQSVSADLWECADDQGCIVTGNIPEGRQHLRERDRERGRGESRSVAKTAG